MAASIGEGKELTFDVEYCDQAVTDLRLNALPFCQLGDGANRVSSWLDDASRYSPEAARRNTTASTLSRIRLFGIRSRTGPM